MNFLTTATIIDEVALPIDTNVIWHAICIPKINNTSQYILNDLALKIIKSLFYILCGAILRRQNNSAKCIIVIFSNKFGFDSFAVNVSY